VLVSSVASSLERIRISYQTKLGNLPALLVESHIVGNEAKIKNICRSFQLCSLQFGIDMGGCLNGVACYDCIIIPWVA
jgi:hypothetical protein